MAGENDNVVFLSYRDRQPFWVVATVEEDKHSSPPTVSVSSMPRPPDGFGFSLRSYGSVRAPAQSR